MTDRAADQSTTNPASLSDGRSRPYRPYPVQPPSWASRRRVRGLGALVAAGLALAPVLSPMADFLVRLNTGRQIASTLLLQTWVSLGSAIVAGSLGWWFAPEAVGIDRWHALRTTVRMAIWAIGGGALVAIGGGALVASVPPVASWASSSVDMLDAAVGIDVAVGILAFAALGIVVAAAILVFVTLPMALAWVAILRTIGWLATRRQRTMAGRTST